MVDSNVGVQVPGGASVLRLGSGCLGWVRLCLMQAALGGDPVLTKEPSPAPFGPYSQWSRPFLRRDPGSLSNQGHRSHAGAQVGGTVASLAPSPGAEAPGSRDKCPDIGKCLKIPQVEFLW